MSPRTAVLLGASGLVGGFCLQALQDTPEYAKAVALTRRELPLRPHAKLTQKITDMSRLNAADFAGADDVFCALGTTIAKAGSQEAFRAVDYDLPLLAARAAKEAGTRQFVLVSSVGADPAAKNFYLRTKGELERDLAGIGFAALHVFRPGLLLGNREEFRLGELFAQKVAPALNPLMAGALRRYRSIKAETVGRAMVGAAKQGRSGKFVYEYDEIVRLAAG